MQNPLGGHPLRSVILGSVFLQNLRGTPLAIYDFGIYFMQKPLGGHPLRSVILGSVFFYKILGGHPLRFVILGSILCKTTLEETPLAICDFGLWFFTRP